MDTVQRPPEPVLGRRVQHLRSDPRRARCPASQNDPKIIDSQQAADRVMKRLARRPEYLILKQPHST